MDHSAIKWVIVQLAEKLKHKFNHAELDRIHLNPKEFDGDLLPDFMLRLNESGNKVKIVFIEHWIEESQLLELFRQIYFPILVFHKHPDTGVLSPAILSKEKNQLQIEIYFEGEVSKHVLDDQLLQCLVRGADEKILYMASFAFESLVSEDEDERQEYEKLDPVSRLIRLLGNERREILFIYIYAVIIGLVSLSLPLGIQSIVSLISSGVIFSTVVWLIAFVLIGILVSGGLQIMQITIVEVLQRRIFAKAAFEFAYRVPKLRLESLRGQNIPELMNRFFDVLTIQKGLPKLLVDLSGALLQILFGLLLLAFYHPFFVFFGIGLVVLLFLIFYWTGPKGLESSIKESKYKYLTVHWMEELARAVQSFKLAGNTNLPMRRADESINFYLKYRLVHFRILISQYSFIILFKFLVTGGMLIIGSLLVIDRQITLGMFVASEIVIILILFAVEKLITYMDVIYDMLTAVDKIGHVTDLPLERYGGIRFSNAHANPKGFEIILKDLKYKYEGHKGNLLNGVNLYIKSGERVCITGFNNSGKSTLLNILAGLYNGYEGIATLDGISLKDFDLISYRNHVAKNISPDHIFDGTLFENVTVGKDNIDYRDVVWALESVGLMEHVNTLPDGLNTRLTAGGKLLSTSMINKLILARCVAERPQLLILKDFFHNFHKVEKQKLINFLVDPVHPWTMVAVSDDPIILGACDKVVLLQAGQVMQEGTYDELKKNELFKQVVLNI